MVQDEEKSIIRVLNIFVSISLVGSMLVAIIGFMNDASYQSIRLAGVFATVLCVTILVLLRARKYTAAKIILPACTYIIATFLIFTSDEVSVRDEAVLLYSLVVAMGGLLLRERGVVIFGALSLITVEVSVFAEIQGWIVNHLTAKTTIPATMVTSGVVYGLTFFMMYIMVDILTKNLINSRFNRQGLQAANEQLTTVRESLEQLVNERTRAAEQARAEAEAARHEAELQAWLSHGQAQFADQIRGDLDLPKLADNIAAHLSRYMGAECGAVFVTSGDAFKLTGGYAYAVQHGQPSEFRLGEGLVGKSARLLKILRTADIPADAPRITSALGESVPRELLVVPLETNGQVLGIAQFATLSHFTVEHETFLALVAESAAIALRSSQTRMQMKELFENFPESKTHAG